MVEEAVRSAGVGSLALLGVPQEAKCVRDACSRLVPSDEPAMRGDRVSVLYSNKDYSSEWNYHPDSKRFQAVDNTRFGVNLVVYALTG